MTPEKPVNNSIGDKLSFNNFSGFLKIITVLYNAIISK